jgi:hypothetical protein
MHVLRPDGELTPLNCERQFEPFIYLNRPADAATLAAFCGNAPCKLPQNDPCTNRSAALVAVAATFCHC